MLRVVADANIYVSALNFGGVPDQFLALARRGRVHLFISKPILDEIEGVLKRKFKWPPTRVRKALTVTGGSPGLSNRENELRWLRGTSRTIASWSARLPRRRLLLSAGIPISGISVPSEACES